jgi:hypothetical protein
MFRRKCSSLISKSYCPPDKIKNASGSCGQMLVYSLIVLLTSENLSLFYRHRSFRYNGLHYKRRIHEYREYFKFSLESSNVEKKNPTRRVLIVRRHQNADPDTWLRDKNVLEAGANTQHVKTQ